MAEAYCQIELGEGVVTHADAALMVFEGLSANILKVSGDPADMDAWALRVGVEWLTEAAAMAVIAAANGRYIARLDFRNRFTLAEKEAIYTAAASTVAVRVWLDDLAAVDRVNLDAAETIAGVNYLCAVLGTPARAAEILA